MDNTVRDTVKSCVQGGRGSGESRERCRRGGKVRGCVHDDETTSHHHPHTLHSGHPHSAGQTEPYTVCSVVEPLSTWSGPPSHSWMGEIRDGDHFLKCQKYQRRTDTVYMEAAGSNSTFFLIAEDVRIVFEQHTEQQRIERSRRGSVQSAPQPTTFQLAESELETLKNRVYIHSRDSGT